MGCSDCQRLETELMNASVDFTNANSELNHVELRAAPRALEIHKLQETVERTRARRNAVERQLEAHRATHLGVRGTSAR
jgi:hypothetical protein